MEQPILPLARREPAGIPPPGSQGSSCHGIIHRGARGKTALQPAKAWTHPREQVTSSGSHTSRERGQEALSPVPHSPHTPQPLLSWGLGAEPAPNTAPWGWATRARTDGKGGQQGLTLPAAVLAPLMFPVCCRGAPSAPPRGNEGGWRETEALGEAREHTSIDTAAGHRPPASLGAKSQL